MYDTMFFEIIPNKTISHTNVFVNTSIKEVFAFNVASSGYIFLNIPFSTLKNMPEKRSLL